MNHESSKVDSMEEVWDAYFSEFGYGELHMCEEQCNAIFVTTPEEADVEANTKVVYGD